MSGWTILAMWSLDPGVAAGIAALGVAYAAACRLHFQRRALWFAAGLVVLIVALLSPIDELGETYLFSAHMVEHVLIFAIAPPLLLAGLPERWGRWLASSRLDRPVRAIARPSVAFLVPALVLWGWHLPVLYDAALANDAVHALEHGMLVAAGLLYWWPLLQPMPARRLRGGSALVYLGAGMASSSLLGILITFAAPGLYPAYIAPPDPHGVHAFLRTHWHLTLAFDQQLAGLVMWALGAAGFLGGTVLVMARMFAGDHQLGQES